MVEKWISNYHALTDYLKNNPEIEVSKDTISIPAGLRLEFYRLFDEIRLSFIKESTPGDFLTNAFALKENWEKASYSLTKTLKLARIQLNAKLTWFLKNPTDGLMRIIHDPLFDLLQGKNTVDGFQTSCKTLLGKESFSLMSEGYRRWITLAIIELLLPDKMLMVHAPNSHNSVYLGDSSMGISLIESTVPDPEESSELSFIQAPENAFLVPLCIIHSTLLNNFVSFSPDYHYAFWKSYNLNTKLEWLSLKEVESQFKSYLSWPDITVYTGNEPGGLKLIADYANVARPYLNIEVIEGLTPFTEERFDEIKRHHKVLKPVLGSFVISNVRIPEFLAVNPDEMGGINWLESGYDSKKLEPVASILSNLAG